ncbi:MAG: sedoheptulose 7-phosphate cyclase [Nitriliruptoraceae bacterium]|nr:sedoheptulose 7-phosphate cyclase [Nitriliruptoraceae bacterium]
MPAHRTDVLRAVDDLVDAVSPELRRPDTEAMSDALLHAPTLRRLIVLLIERDAFDADLATAMAETYALDALPALRQLRSSLPASLAGFVALLHQVVRSLHPDHAPVWGEAADRIRRVSLGRRRVLDVLRAGPDRAWWIAFADRLTLDDPHARFPTSPYRWSDGAVISAEGGRVVDATMTSRTSTSVRVTEGVLRADDPLLRDLYAPAGRCVAVIDHNVEEHWGGELRAYFAGHDIELHTLVYRAMEVDKSIRTVERMLGDFKQLGVTRAEPVLVVGGGVLSDTAGLACALYHRSTPYVMLSTSLVSGIDAGPSPRTCCDGFGFKNLFGSYHAPIVSITDRTFLSTMREGWLRHGVAEIIKMAVVKDAALFSALEAAGPALVTTRFGTFGAEADQLAPVSQDILAAAMRSYVEAEYDNLYETHQARPHAYGHTWSPGFEIPAGLLHGHAVAIGMGFGALLSHRAGWIDESSFDRILRLISDFGLSLWHEVLDDADLVWESQQKMEQKRGGQLVAPVPRGAIGSCGYLEAIDREQLVAALRDYRRRCADLPRAGRGIEPLCRDVGLEDPSTVGIGQAAPLATEREGAKPAA